MDELLLVIKPGEDLPATGKLMTVQTYLSETPMTIKVKRINSLRWNNQGSVIATIEYTIPKVRKKKGE